MAISLFLAKVFGIYLIIIGLMLILQRQTIKDLSLRFFADKPLLWGMSIFTLILGILLIVSHNVWVASWVVIITILAWLTFIKGLINTVWPTLMERAMPTILDYRFLIVAGVIDVILGLFLFGKGFGII